MATKSLCSIPDCCKAVKARGYCSTHYSRLLVHGNAARLTCPPNGTLAGWIVGHVAYDDDQCLIWPFSRNPSGYACQVFMDGQKTYAHRHMCRLAHGEPPSPDYDTAHSCGRGHDGCIHPGHLSWKTRAGNMDDMINHGRTNRGERCPTSKLTANQVREIRLLSGTMPQRALAERFGTTQGNINNIILRKRWAWLE